MVITAGRSRHCTNTVAEGRLAMATDTVKLRESVTDRQKWWGGGGRGGETETEGDKERGRGMGWRQTDRQTDGQTEGLDQNTKKKRLSSQVGVVKGKGAQREREKEREKGERERERRERERERERKREREREREKVRGPDQNKNNKRLPVQVGVVITDGRPRHRTNTAAEDRLAMATNTVKLDEREKE